MPTLFLSTTHIAYFDTAFRPYHLQFAECAGGVSHEGAHSGAQLVELVGAEVTGGVTLAPGQLWKGGRSHQCGPGTRTLYG